MADYVQLICTLFDKFEQYQHQQQGNKMGKPYTYSQKVLLIFFLVMQFRRIFKFKAQRRWLEKHPDLRAMLGFERIPHRTTLSRRYKQMDGPLQDFVAFLGQYAQQLDEQFSQADLVEDKSLCKALGPVWHQKDRQAGRIPDKLRNLDTDATWCKSGYQGWVYGYGLHLTCNLAAFPQLVVVTTAATSETKIIEQKEAFILETIQPRTLAADNSYTKASRIRRWFKQGVALLTPAKKWVKGRFAGAYHRLLKQPHFAACLKQRRTPIEPLFDLIAKVLGTTGKHKQLPVQRLDNVQTCLALATLSVQIAMLTNNIWGLPPRNISEIASAFT
jgi:hypothetical protein